MADQIVACNKILNADDEVVQYDVAYTVEDGSRTNNFCVTILAEDMDDPDDATEAKTLANARAATIKSAWVAQAVTSQEEVASVVGSVTL